ncbi:MAG TPA: CPBP family intramembrane glutamic endopeptidase [Candidatus Acidoferrales bacterium]|nr:CPBP family intramembrane glutamic endopeptidase [Candidatus Acidoferrales bacterium]
MNSSNPSSPGSSGAPGPAETPNTPEILLSPQNLQNANVPEDIRVPWGWLELGLFLVFSLVSIVVVYGAANIYLLVRYHMNFDRLQKFLSTSAPFTIGVEVIWSLLLLGFMILMIRFYHGQRFWVSIGWRKLRLVGSPGAAALLCIIAGLGLALVVAIASPLVSTKAHVPMEELFASRTDVLWLMCYGILFAPFWEETLFRGFLYPIFARQWGISAGIIVTGVLFGAMHAAQLWGGWGQIALLTFVGIVLTWIRARAGSVAASFLVHLTYNSILFAAFYVGTRGFHHLPPVH